MVRVHFAGSLSRSRKYFSTVYKARNQRILEMIFFQDYKYLSSHSGERRPRSPYAILGLKTSATEKDIKLAFRKVSE